MGNLNKKTSSRSKGRKTIYNHNAVVKILGPYVSQVSSKIAGCFEHEEIAAEFIKLLQEFPNLESVSFPQHLRYKATCLDDKGHCLEEQSSSNIKLEEFLRLHPIPILPQLRQLSFASFPDKLVKKILNIYAPQLESLRLLADYTIDNEEEKLIRMPKLEELQIDILLTDNALVYLNQLVHSPLKNVSLCRGSDEDGQQQDYEIVPLLVGIRDSSLFQKTLKVLQLEFSGSVMWSKYKFPQMSFPALKTLKLKHCSNVNFGVYSQFLFSLCSINRLTIDKANCAHKQLSTKCSHQACPINCFAVGCQYRSQIANSGLWEKLPKLQFLFFRGCGMKNVETLSRRTFYRFSHQGKDFMTFFTDPRKSDIWN